MALVVVQEMCSRLGVYTGEGLGGLIREQFSPRATFAAMTLLLVANAGLTVSEFAGVGGAMEVFGVSRFISVPIAAVFVWALTVLGSYSRTERLFMVLTLAFLTYPIAAFLGHPNGHEVLTNLVSPHFPASHAFLVLAVALIGTTITPYMQFYDASAVVDKHITPANYRSERIDSVTGSIWSNVISIFIIIATAAAMGGDRAAAIGATGRRGPEARGRPGGARTLRRGSARGLAAGRFGGAVVDLLRHRGRGRRPAIGVGEIAAGPTLLRHFYFTDRGGRRRALAPGNLVALVVNAQVLNGVITPLLLTYILILANRSTVLGPAKNGPVFKAVATVCVAVVGLLSFVVLIQTMSGLG